MSFPSWARKGVEVVCIRDFAGATTVYDRGIRRLPELRKTYVIADVEVWDEYAATVLVFDDFPGQAFDIVGFQPATKRTVEQDIAEHFANLLKVDAPEWVSA